MCSPASAATTAQADKGGKAGVFRRAADDGGLGATCSRTWRPSRSSCNPRDPNLVFAGTTDGVYRSTDRGATFKRTNFPDRGVQIWSFMIDPANPKRMLAGGSPVSVYRSEDGGESWKRHARARTCRSTPRCRSPAA